MHERLRRQWAAGEAMALGYGGIAVVSRATGIAPSTIGEARREMCDEKTRIVGARSPYRPGGGRQRHRSPILSSCIGCEGSWIRRRAAIQCLHCDGRVRALVRWRRRSGRRMESTSATRRSRGCFGNSATVCSEPRRRSKGSSTWIATLSLNSSMLRRRPYVARCAVSLRRHEEKELVGNFANAGREWRLEGASVVDVHDFPSDAVGKAIPYGVLDVADNSAFVNVGIDHDTPVFAVTSIAAWWKRMGVERYPDAREIYVTADAGGSNSYRARMVEVRAAATRRPIGNDIPIVSHFPPGTSKRWNKIEHRLLRSSITLNWRGHPLRSYETVVKLISGTTTSRGLLVRATLDRRCYPLWQKRSAPESCR